MATASPSYIFATGAQYAKRGSNDTGLDATDAFTVSITYDPESFGSNGADAVVVGKIRTDNNQRGWVIEHIQSDGTCRLTVYGAGDGSINATRKTTAAIRNRANVTFTCSVSAGVATLNAYVDGAASNGSATSAGAFGASPYSSTEALAFFARDTSGTPAEAMRGSIHMFAYLSYVASGGDISGQAALGLLNSTLAASGSLVAYWRHLDVTTNAASDVTAWTDFTGSKTLTFTKISGSVEVKGQAQTGTAILACNQWNYTLTDSALGSTSLTTTYTDTDWADPLYDHYRARVAGTQNAAEPGITGVYRSYVGDFTVAVRTRKFTGISQTYVLRRRGIDLICIYGNEFYCVVGDAGTSINKRISWGFNLFQTTATDCTIVLRYNSVEQDVDLFIGGVFIPQSAVLTEQSTNQLATGIYFSYDADWVFAYIAPTCLSDAQIRQFVVGLAPFVSGQGTETLAVGAVASPNRPGDYGPIEGDTWPPAAVTDPGWAEETLSLETQVCASPGPDAALKAVGQTESPYLPADLDPPLDDLDQYDPGDPNPVVTSAVLSLTGAVTVSGQAGAYSATKSTTWWEIIVRPNEFIAQGTPVTNRDLNSQRLLFSDSFQLGPEFNATGYSVVLAVQPQGNAQRIYRSAPFALSATAPVNPAPTMVSVVINADGSCTATANAGPTDAGNFDVWFEVEQTIAGNDYIRMSPVDTSEVFAGNRNHVTTFALGSRTGWTGKRVRFYMQVAASPGTTFVSTGLALTDWSYTWTTPTIVGTPTLNLARLLSATGRAGPTDVGLCATFWEIEQTTGEVFVVGDRRTNVDFSSQADVTDSFTIPGSFPVGSKSLRFCVVPNADATVTYRSSPYSLVDAVPTSPSLSITSATCTLGKLLQASVDIGTSTGGPASEQWEVLHDGTWQSVFASAASVALTAGQTRTLSHQLPNRLDLTGLQIRYRLTSTALADTEWVSGTTTVTQTAAISPNPTLSAADVDAGFNFTSTGSLAASNLGTVDYQWEVGTSSDFKAVMEFASVALSPTLPTPVSASVLLPAEIMMDGLSARLVVRSQTFPELSYTSAPFTVTQATFSPPAMAMTVSSQAADGTLTLQGTIAASSITSATVYFEVSGVVTDFDGILQKTTGVNISAGYVLNASIAADRLSFDGKSVAIKFSTTIDPGTVYSSTTAGITQTSFVDPAPAVSAAAVSVAGLFTATSAAGPTDIGTATWWLESNFSGTFTAVMDTHATADLSGTRRTLSTSINLPTRFDLTGKSVRLVVMQNDRPDNQYTSASFPVTVTAQSPPSMSMVYATISLASLFTAQVVLGANNLGTVKTWWESDISTPGVFTALFNTVNTFALSAGGTTVNGSAQLPDRFDLTGKTVRFAIASAYRPEIVYYSSPIAIDVENLTDPVPVILSHTVGVFGDIEVHGRAGPTNAAFCQVWLEVDGISVSMDGIFEKTNSVNLTSQQFLDYTFTVPRGEFQDPTGNFSYTGKTITLNVRPNNRAEQVFTSPAQSVALPARISPAPTVTGTPVVTPGTYRLTGTTGVSNLEDCVAWFEIDSADDGIIVLPASAALDVATGRTWEFDYDVPSGANLIGASLYLVIQPVRDRMTTYRSSAFILTDPGFDKGCGAHFTQALPSGVSTVVFSVAAPVSGITANVTITNGILTRTLRALMTHDGAGTAAMTTFNEVGDTVPVTLSANWSSGVQLTAFTNLAGWTVSGQQSNI